MPSLVEPCLIYTPDLGKGHGLRWLKHLVLVCFMGTRQLGAAVNTAWLGEGAGSITGESQHPFQGREPLALHTN